MVIFFEWHQTAMDQKSRSGLQMTGEDTGLDALSSPLVGYLGKVQQRAASLEYCPWCISKGLTYTLRSYHINLQDSITLCTNPQCLFPLVSQSLEDVLANLVPVEPTIGGKRKKGLTLEKEDLSKPAQKRLRSSEADGLQSATDTFSQEEHEAATIVRNEQSGSRRTDVEEENGNHMDTSKAQKMEWDSAQSQDDILDKLTENAACTDHFAPLQCSVSAQHLESSSDALLNTDVLPALSLHCGALGVSEGEADCRQLRSISEALNRQSTVDHNQSFSKDDGLSPQNNVQMGQASQAAGLPTCKDIKGFQSETEDKASTTIMELMELVPIPNQLFWSNRSNLCWLDSMLVALVNCKSLRKHIPNDEPQQSSVWCMMRGYDDVCAAIQGHQQCDKDDVMKVPNNVWQKANADLHSVRMSVFKLLQPRLHCKLGKWETPVFALPLLLAMDTWAEPLFRSIFHWEFKCSECKAASKERVMNTLPTFTNISPHWHPLHAVHLAPCNMCSRKNQRRTMTLESVPPVFGLHFVQGLPDSDVRNYSFTFNGNHYSITTVIQYNQQLKHFVTWVRRPDGSWLEYDDLKHPECRTHDRLRVPAEEIHIVFWEMENKEPPACSPSSTFPENPPSQSQLPLSPADKGSTSDEPSDPSSDHSLVIPHNDTDIISSLLAPEEGNNIMDSTAAADTSIGSATLLDTFEGLSHNDIITLTLVEIKADSDAQLVNDNGGSEMLECTPDSSSAASNNNPVELPTSCNSSAEGGSSVEPALVAGETRGRGRGRQRGKKAALNKAAPDIPPPECSEPTKAISDNLMSADQDNKSPRETTQQASPVSSSDILPLTTVEKCPISAPAQNSRWSFLLSKHPLLPPKKPDGECAPALATQAKPTLLTHSTPNPVRRHQIPGERPPKPQLKTEESDGLPIKAAEMYDGFGVKSSVTRPNPSPELNHKSNLFQPVPSNHQRLPVSTKVVSGTSLPTPGAKVLSETLSTKKRSSLSSKIPPGLSDTEALRYKLIKKLKAKKKKLAKLNELLGHQGAASLPPDSTNLSSPSTVTSSTYDGSLCDSLLLDLLSPATTASNLSPDSTGYLEMLATGQGVDQLGADALSQVNACSAQNFLDDFISQAVAQGPTEMETETLSALDLFAL